MTDLKHADIDINFASRTHQEEIDTWLQIHGLEKRYKNEMKNGEAKFWLENFKIILPSKTLTRHIKYQKQIDYLMQNKSKDLNFLKVPFYHACRKRKLI